MVDLLVLGGLGVDVRVRVPVIPPPAVDSLTVAPIDLRIGHTGAGVALAAHALGLRVAVVDVLGADPPGDVVRAALARTRVHAVLRPAPGGTRRSVNLVDPHGRRMSLYDPRPPWAGPPPFDVAELTALTGDAAHVHVSIMDWARELLPALRDGLPAGTRISTDLHDWNGHDPYHRPFAEVADLVFVSGVRLGERAAELAAALAPRTVIVTHGAEGATLYHTGGSTRIPAATPPAPVVDSNGAGDAFAASFLAATLRGARTVDAARYAAEVAAAACAHDGMEYPPGLLPTHR